MPGRKPGASSYTRKRLSPFKPSKLDTTDPLRGWDSPFSSELFALQPEYTPGDLSVDPFNLYGEDPEEVSAHLVLVRFFPLERETLPRV